jgi:hypothetical protein
VSLSPRTDPVSLALTAHWESTDGRNCHSANAGIQTFRTLGPRFAGVTMSTSLSTAAHASYAWGINFENV